MKIILFALFIIAVPGFANSGGTVKNIQITSDNLKIDSQGKQAVFTGNVRAKIGTLIFSCYKMVITYGDKGSIVQLVANGSVTVKKEDAKATAKKAVYNAGTRMLMLSGNPVLTKGVNRLKGDRIEVNVDNGNINITRATGTFSFKSNNNNQPLSLP